MVEGFGNGGQDLKAERAPQGHCTDVGFHHRVERHGTVAVGACLVEDVRAEGSPDTATGVLGIDEEAGVGDVCGRSTVAGLNRGDPYPGASNNTTFNNSCLPAQAQNNLIAAYWDDLDMTVNPSFGTAGIYTSTTGVAGSRIFNIEYRACTYNVGACGGDVNFEVRLYEGQTKLDVIYATVASAGSRGKRAGAGRVSATSRA